MAPYRQQAGGYLQDPSATDTCAFCTYGNSDAFLEALNMSYADVWRNFGLMWVYVAVNIAGAVFLYWLARVPKRARHK